MKKQSSRKKAEPGDIIMAVTSENIEDVCKCIAWLGNSKVAVSGHAAIIHHNLNPKFLTYYLSSSLFYKQKLSMVQGTKVIEVSPEKLKKTFLPVPPLEVQQEIVRILDQFTELTAELTARKKQFEFYRSSILRSCKNAQVKTLGEICDFVRGPFGGSLKKEIFKTHGYAVYEQQHAIYGMFHFRYFIDKEKYETMRRFAVAPGDLLMSYSGTMGKITIVPKDAPAGIINQALLKLTPKKEIDNRYLKYSANCNNKLDTPW